MASGNVRNANATPAATTITPVKLFATKLQEMGVLKGINLVPFPEQIGYPLL